MAREIHLFTVINLQPRITTLLSKRQQVYINTLLRTRQLPALNSSGGFMALHLLKVVKTAKGWVASRRLG